MIAEGTEGDSMFSSLRDLIQTLKRRLWLLVLVLLICVGVAVGLSFLVTPKYEATVKLLIAQTEESSVPGGLGSDVQGLQQLTQTVAEGINSGPLAEDVIRQLGLQTTQEALLTNMEARPIRDTQFVSISYRDTSPEGAQEIADTLGREVAEQTSNVMPSATGITATVWTPAVVPDSPVTPNLMLNFVIGLIVGSMLGVGLIFLVESLDSGWRSLEEAERISGARAFGVIPHFEVVDR
jgi:capsular polysaccharide biosynthesis protein